MYVTFLVTGILLKFDISKMKDSGYHSEEVGLFRRRETDTVHGMSESSKLLFVVERGVVEGGGV